MIARHSRAAFPYFDPEINAQHTGMTLRDYFAAGVASGLATSTDQYGTWAYDNAGGVARRAYEIADAMIAERESNGD